MSVLVSGGFVPLKFSTGLEWLCHTVLCTIRHACVYFVVLVGPYKGVTGMAFVLITAYPVYFFTKFEGNSSLSFFTRIAGNLGNGEEAVAPRCAGNVLPVQ